MRNSIFAQFRLSIIVCSMFIIAGAGDSRKYPTHLIPLSIQNCIFNHSVVEMGFDRCLSALLCHGFVSLLSALFSVTPACASAPL